MSTHPTLARYRAIVSAAGSTATTPRGVLNYLRSMRPRTVRPPWETAQYRPRWKAYPPSFLYAPIAAYRDALGARKRDPEAKRARDDAKFRRNYLARLRRREAAALRYDATTLDGILARVDSEESRLAELSEVARLRTIATGKPGKPVELPACEDGALVPIDAQTARKCGASINMAGKDATLRPCRKKSHGHHEAAYTDWSKGSNKPRGVRAVHDNYVRSLAVHNTTTADYVCHATRVKVTLPTGYRWEIDGNGLRAVEDACPVNDYHPTAAELLAKGAAEKIVAKLVANRETRQRLAAERAVEAARVAGVYVCLRDSLRAGNCEAGTLAFAARHGLDRARHYSAPELLAIANGDASRVRLAVTAARLRHEREMAAGVCLLSDHRA